MDLEDFTDEYADRANDVEASSYRTFAQRLRDWFTLLDETPQVSAVVTKLESTTDFQEWYTAGLGTVRGMVGSGRLAWADDRTTRLGQTIGLFRHLSQEEMAFSRFCSSFFWAGKNYDDMVYKITAEMFAPFARDLLKHIQRQVASKPIDAAPASDRIVTLDHNSAPYRELTTSLSRLEEHVRGLNDFPDSAEERERILAELSAGGRLLAAARARVDGMVAVLLPALKWLGEKIADNLVSILVTAAMGAIALVLGITIPGIP